LFLFTVEGLLQTIRIVMHDGKDSTSNELYAVVTELRDKLDRIESSHVTTPTVSATAVDYRIVPDVGISIWTFTGHESKAKAEDWVSSVDGLAQVNQWPLRHQMMYVRSHLASSARSWYLMEDFGDWDHFI